MNQARLRELFAYDPAAGSLVWLVNRPGRPAGAVAGGVNGVGYVTVGVDGKRMLAHRVIWCLVHGVAAPNEIDHINGVRSDNRLENLRLATKSQNRQNTMLSKNNSSGIQGVAFDAAKGKWIAQIMVRRKHIHLGGFEDKEAAALVRALAEEKFHPFRKVPAHVASL